MIELWQAIDDFFQSAGATTTTFRAALVGGLHNLEAPQSVSFPFGTFQLISAVPDHFASNKNFIENCLIQFNLFSKRRTMAELLDIYDKLVDCFDYLTLTIDNYTTRSCVRESTIQTRVEKVWQMNVSYRLLLEPD